MPDIPYCKFDKFKEVTLPDTKDIVSIAKKSHCERDPFPIGDIKEQRNIDRLTGVIHRITNLSLENGSFLKTEKEASVKPTLKSGKDQQNVESYRPISNVSFLGKTIEMAAKKQLIAHMETLNVLPEEQSAYRCDGDYELIFYMVFSQYTYTTATSTPPLKKRRTIFFSLLLSK